MKSDFQLIHLPEPLLLFGHGQAMEDPRHGLAVLGPYQKLRSSVNYGMIGTRDGIRRMKDWVQSIQRPISEETQGRPPFPGFEAAFGIQWATEPNAEIEIDEAALMRVVNIDDVNKRVHETVGHFLSRIVKHQKNEDVPPDIWFVVIPNIVKKHCRPQSKVPVKERVVTTSMITKKEAVAVAMGDRFLFDSMNIEAEPYLHKPDFHHQLKGRMLKHGILTQIVLEGTIAHHEFLRMDGKPKINYSTMLSQIAWNICSAVYYKVAGRPWQLDGVRPGVCYLGLVFKRDDKGATDEDACCAAQMFLNSGDGVVFKGHHGPWYSPESRQFHLSGKAAHALLSSAIESYKETHDEKAPTQVFIHGRTNFDDDEWAGFERAAGKNTQVIGVQIGDAKQLRFYRPNSGQPVMRGLAWVQSETSAMLMTNGYLPSLGTYPGKEVPLPLDVKIVRGEEDIVQVLKDILGLTKLNYNSCRFGDGDPVTLKFADDVGEVLLSVPKQDEVPPMPFKHYI